MNPTLLRRFRKTALHGLLALITIAVSGILLALVIPEHVDRIIPAFALLCLLLFFVLAVRCVYLYFDQTPAVEEPRKERKPSRIVIVPLFLWGIFGLFEAAFRAARVTLTGWTRDNVIEVIGITVWSILILWTADTLRSKRNRLES